MKAALQRVARMNFLNHAHYTNEATPFLSEYIEHKRMQRLGVTVDRESLGEYMTAVFLILDESFERLIEEKRRRESRKTKG